jgi:hypothetical protein
MRRRPVEQREAELRFVEKVCIWLDHKYQLKGTKFKYGIDPIIGLVPFLGHAVTFVISGVLVLVMLRHGGSGKLAIKMVINVLLDTVIGAVPILGNLFDFVFKANMKNLRLLKEHYEQGRHMGSGLDIIIIILVVLMVLLIGIVVLFAWAINLIVGMLF